MAEYKPRNYRIVRHITRARILDVQDMLAISKLRVEIVDFEQGQGARSSAEHFAEPDAIALVCHDIVHGRPWEKYVEFKGGVRDGQVESRILTIERVEARNPIKITVSRGPGERTRQGAVQPKGKPETSVSILLSEWDARRIALTILRHLAAYEAATYHQRVAEGTRQTEEAPAAEAPAQGTRSEPHWTTREDLREQFARRCVELGVNSHEVAAWLGNPISAAGRSFKADMALLERQAAARQKQGRRAA